MDKLNFDINQFLRFLLAGGWTVGCYFFINPHNYWIFINGKIIDLIFLSLVIGSLIYVLHRALVYPNLYKLIYGFVALFRKMKWDWWTLLPFIPSKTEISIDLQRWAHRKNEDSLSKNIVDWGSQVHFLYCSALGSLLTIIFSKHFENYFPERISYVWLAFFLLLFAGLIHNTRLLLYDIELRNREDQQNDEIY